ncbi:uncharacterized protein UHOD_12110 [Ustilago sp. UG-2017b]|nr:uncharacterized protein UHOD_12110 [Ustilago sp. UG-2017b]
MRGAWSLALFFFFFGPRISAAAATRAIRNLDSRYRLDIRSCPAHRFDTMQRYKDLRKSGQGQVTAKTDSDELRRNPTECRSGRENVRKLLC